MIFDLNRMKIFMDSLQNPQNLFQAIHIAGTNGKGSVAKMFYSILKAAHKKVGLYTSPHLQKIQERFQASGKQISSADLSRLTFFLKNHVQRRMFPFNSLTQFEFLTALSFLWLAEQKVEYSVIETGLGGRLDATNVMGNVVLAVITNVDLEHTQLLGKTRREIAFEKAGIIKKNIPVITGAKGEARNAIKEMARLKKAPVYYVPALKLRPPWLPRFFPLQGRHQWHNAAIVKKGISLIPDLERIKPRKFKEGLRKAVWPGRFEKFEFKYFGKKRIVFLDGAHNPAAAKALKDTLLDQGINKVVLLWGMLKDKDRRKFIQELAPFIVKAAVVTLPSPRTCDPKVLSMEKALQGKFYIGKNLEDGWMWSLRESGEVPLLVTGSLYLVGAVRGLAPLRNVHPNLD